MYGETLGEGLIGIPNSSRRNKMFNNLAAHGQGTPLRNRIDSDVSRLGVFPSIRGEESLMPSKADP